MVLNIEFGPMIRSMFEVLSVLAINLKSILQIDCLSNLSFCASAKTSCLLLTVVCLPPVRLKLVCPSAQMENGLLACSLRRYWQ